MNLLYQVCDGVIAVDETESSVTLEVGSQFYSQRGTMEKLRKIAVAYMEKDCQPDMEVEVQRWPVRQQYIWESDSGNVSLWLLPIPHNVHVR